jgi:hypothetical protein
MNLRRFSSLTLLCTALCILGGVPVSAQPASGPNNRVIYPDVNVCVQNRYETPCFKVPYKDPDLISLMKRHNPKVNKISIPWLHDALESGNLAIITWGGLGLGVVILLIHYSQQRTRKND